MSGTKLTYLICLDEHRNFTEDIKKRFSDSNRYEVLSFVSVPDFIESFRKERDGNSCKVGIIGVPENREQYDTTGSLTQEIKKADHSSGIILLVPPEKMEEVQKAVKYNIDAYIPKNANSILRIHNTVKKLISEHNISIFRRKRNFSLYVLLAFLIFCGLLIVLAYLKFPHYF